MIQSTFVCLAFLSFLGLFLVLKLTPTRSTVAACLMITGIASLGLFGIADVVVLALNGEAPGFVRGTYTNVFQISKQPTLAYISIAFHSLLGFGLLGFCLYRVLRWIRRRPKS